MLKILNIKKKEIISHNKNWIFKKKKKILEPLFTF